MDAAIFINKHKNKILNIAVLIIAFIIANNIYKKQTKEMESLKMQIDTEKKKNAEFISIGQLSEEINRYKASLTKREANITTNAISNIAKNSNIEVLSIKPEAERKLQDYIKQPFTLAIVSPDYNVLGTFIANLENYKDVLTVDSVRINPVSQSKKLNVDLTVSSVSFAD